MSDHDQIALDAASRIMEAVQRPMHTGGSAQLKARVQCIVAEAIRTAAPVVDEAMVSEIVREVAELPDRDSPEDWPEAMLVTAAELTEILTAALAQQPGEVDRG
jgi:hypothetical protein